MRLTRNTKHPNFILGIISYILLLAGVVLLESHLSLGRQLILASLISGGVHWIAGIVDVLTDPKLKDPQSRYFWFALVLMVPPLAGMIYYMTDGRRFSY